MVLDALDTVGVHGDGRLLALGSYENRVYRVHLEEAVQGHEAVVAKFYRPGRWSAAQIQEEHDFALDLVAQEVPVVAPLELQGRTLHEAQGFYFSVSPVRGGRSPELDDFEVLEWIGRFLGRIHTVGAAHAFACRPTLDVHSFAMEPAQWLQTHQMIPLEVEHAWHHAFEQALALVQAAFASSTAQPIRL
ncbi:MAG: hypothetical protein RIS04_317, partial [Pseudomonadota bacterium]